MKYKILIAFFLLLSAVCSAQLQPVSAGGSPTTIATFQGGVKGKLYSFISIKDTLNNAATYIPGAMTIRPQDTIGHITFPIYQSNGVYWTKVSSSTIIVPGVDSVTVYGNQLCQWMGGIATCYFLTPSSGGAVDSFHLNFDSTWILHFRNGTQLGDSIFLFHTYLYADGVHLTLTSYLPPFGQLINAYQLLDSAYASPYANGFNYFRYANGQIDSLSGGGGGGSGAIDTMYVTPDSLYLVVSYVGPPAKLDSIQWIGGSGSGGSSTFAGLSDVSLTSLVNNQIAVYNSGTGFWENQTPVKFTLAGKRPNDILLLDSTNNQFYNYRVLFTGSTTTKKMLVIDTITHLPSYAEIPTLANDSWALAGNTVVNGNKFGSVNNRSVNIYTNDSRIANFDSLGTFNIYPLTSTSIGMTMFRASSTVNFPFRLSGDASSNAVISSTNNAIIVKTNFNSGGGNLENWRFTENVTGATRASLPQAILTGKMQAQVATPSGVEISNAIEIAGLSGPTNRFNLGIDVNNDAIFSLNNVGFRLYQSNDAASGYAFGAGDYMRAFATTGNIMIKNKGTYTQDTSSRFSVISNRQGSLPAPVMATSDKLGISTGMVGGIITNGGSGYGNATYVQVPFTGGSGSGARAFNVTVAGGIVTAVNMSGDPGRGTGYAVGDVLSISNANLGGSGSGFQYTVSVLTNTATAKGLQVYDSTVNQKSKWNGTNWDAGVTVSSAGTLTLEYGNDYIFTGTTATYTLPVISTSILGRQNSIVIKNRGSGTITLNTATGSTIYSTSAVSTINVVAGAAAQLLPDGTYNLVLFNQ